MTGPTTPDTDVVDVIYAALVGGPHSLWRVGDLEACALAVHDAIRNYLQEPAEPPAPTYVLGRRPFTSDDAAAITVLAIAAPVIGAVLAVVHRIRRAHRAVTS